MMIAKVTLGAGEQSLFPESHGAEDGSDRVSCNCHTLP
jgi:hypothetical protein